MRTVLRFLVLSLVFAPTMTYALSALLVDGYRIYFFPLFAVAVIALFGSDKIRKRRWQTDPATEAQKEYARNLGIKFSSNITKGDMSHLISMRTGK